MKLKCFINKWLQQYAILLYILNVSAFYATAQQIPNFYSNRTVDLTINTDTVWIDSSIRFVPSTVIIKNGDVILRKQFDYRIMTELGCLVFDSVFIGQKVVLSGRVFDPAKIAFETFHKDPRIIEPVFMQNPFVYHANENAEFEDIFKQSGLNIQGNISRGVGVGNTQDLAVNSDMNLQINGKLGNDITIEAAISDQNNPIQPEGNTQQLQDFDQVYISFSKDSSKLRVGDFLMSGNRQDYFMKFNKKSRGLQFVYLDTLFGGRNYTVAEFAISRGRYARNEIQGQEGNQGPYRLSGINNELFIIIISGTESVYVDGKQMQRGQQNDYVIDYNSGELTFMPRTLITQYSRIVVEFQYADRNYGRSILHGSDIFQKNKVTFRANYFSEQDNKRQPYQQSLDLFDSSSNRSAEDVLTEAGNNSSLMNIPNVRKYRTFQPDKIMYRLIDTLGTSIYRYTDDPASDSIFYQVTFSRTEPGIGNYRQTVSLANGRVFEWVAPIGGIPQGNYEPVVQLVAPQRMQMFSAGVDYQPDSNTVISVEMSASNNDQNTFSSLGNSSNAGYAGNIRIERNDSIRLNAKHTLYWQNRLGVEWADKNFNFIERYRDVEFERSWSRQYANPSSIRTPQEERVFNFNGKAGVGDKIAVAYHTSMYQRMGTFEGKQLGYNFMGQHRGFKINQSTSFVQTVTQKLNLVNNPFSVSNIAFDSRGSLSKEIGRSTILSAEYETEESRFKDDTSSALAMTSFRYFQSGVTLQHNVNSVFNGKINFNRRKDFLPKSENLEPSVASNNVSVSIEKEGKKWKDNLNFTLSYRAIEHLDTVHTGNLPDRTLLSRIEYQFGLFHKSIVSNTYYQIGTGQEQKREFVYVEVRQGLGTYVWNDYNKNGIQEINEFETAIFQDQANFIKVLVPTGEYIRSNTNEFNQTLRITPPLQWQSGNRLKKTISRFSALGTYRADRKLMDNRLLTLLNPIDMSIADTALISLSSSMRGTLFFNRANPKFGLDYNYQKNKVKQFLVQGFDSRNIAKHNLNMRINFTADWSLITTGEIGERGYSSDYSIGRNYLFNYVETKPEIFWQPGKSFRIGGFYKYYTATNDLTLGGEKAQWNEYGAEFRTFLKNLTTIDGKFSFVQIHYNGLSSSPVAYDMLQGLQNGKNFSWQCLVGGRIGKNIQITLQYEGRKNETAPTVHVGRVEARYLF
ncbi:MAG: hypothetical protein M0R38_07025 [Bacteroidia bacterium]|nr:hypothetical protein [Bacteroidia bacterium]